MKQAMHVGTIKMEKSMYKTQKYKNVNQHICCITSINSNKHQPSKEIQCAAYLTSTIGLRDRKSAPWLSFPFIATILNVYS